MVNKINVSGGSGESSATGRGEWKVTGCNLCGITCVLEAYVVDNHITEVRPDAKGLRNNMPYCCRKGRSSRYFQENPERLNYPLKKVGDHFERISWEQAYLEIGQKAKSIIDKHGPRSFAFLGGALASDMADIAFVKTSLMPAIGSQYMYNPIGIEFAGHWWSNGRMLGHQGFVVEGDEATADVFIFWGANGYVSHQLLAARKMIKEFSESEDKMIITIDPRLSETARMSDMHIMPRMGSDALMARGLIALILDRGWEDRKFLQEWCSDWERARRWYSDFDYKKAFEVAGVPLEQMEKLAEIMSTRTWGCHQDLGIYFNRNNTISSYLINTLAVITGNMLVKGHITYDQYVPFRDPGDERDEGVWRTVETGVFPVADSYPPAVLADELLSERDDRLRVCFASETNPVMAFPDSERIKEGLDRLELFVVIDIAMTETAKHADYVLPGKTGFEAPQFGIFTDEVATLKRPIIGQIAEREEDNIILLNIARRMGLVPKYPKMILDAAEKSVKNRDILPLLIKTTAWLETHPKYKRFQNIILCDALSRQGAHGSVAMTINRLALVISPQGATGFCDRAGFRPLKKYRFMEKLGPMKQFADMSKMDQVFWAVHDDPHGVRIGVRNPDPIAYAKEKIFYPDKKIRLFDETIDQNIKYITPEREDAALREAMDEYPLILSAGNHADGGDNSSMRNPGTYKYRKPFTLLMNPDDAAALDISDGEEVMLTTRRNSAAVPVQLSWNAAKGYVMIPHHYGMEKDGKIIYGVKANYFTRGEDMDPITHDPYLRWVPCRVEKI